MSTTRHHSRSWRHGTALIAAAAALLGCQQVPTLPTPMGGKSLSQPRAEGPQTAAPEETKAAALPAPPRPPELRKGETLPVPGAGDAAASPVALLNLEQVSLGTFINVAYAEVLKKNVNIDPSILARRDLVTFRSGEGQTAKSLENAVQLLLKSYGISAIDVGGLVRVVPDNASLGALPEIRRGAALPDTPLPLRPVFHLVELQAVRQTDVVNWLRTLFGERVKAQEDSSRNALLLSGTADNVKAALEAIAVLDQPLMSARSSLSITPVFWSADDLARRLAEVLSAQGYAVHPVGQAIVPGSARYPIILLPVSALNAVYVFVSNEQLLAHVRTWAETLDKPNNRGIGKNFLTYSVKHKDAEALASTLEKLLTGSRASATAATPAGAGTPSATGTTAARSSAVVVDKATNTLIFQANPDEFGQINALLQALDRPTKAAMIEVTVAEVGLDDNNQFGIEWMLRGNDGSGNTWSSGTAGGISLGTSGFTYQVLNGAGQVKARLNAMASTNRASILSSPRVMARNGEAATIQVGQEVPILTSQQTAGTTVSTGTTTSTPIISTVQYRTTGVILKVKPVIHSGDQIDLDVTQEVSEAAATETGVSSTPTFSTRKVDTKLTLRNGSTVMLGGLISDTSARGGSGIPLLKDVPVLGALFGKQLVNGTRRELIVLITPYIVSDSYDAETLTEAFRGMLGPWAREQGAGRAVPDKRKDSAEGADKRITSPDVQPTNPSISGAK
jgi:general secretion pathway protein D